MSPRTAEQFEQIRKNKEQLIRAAALELFAHKGYHNSSISELAKNAGVSKGLVYNYYESKDAILKALLLDLFQELDVIDKLFPNGMTTTDSLAILLDYYIAEIEQKSDHWKLYFSLVLQVDIQAIIGPQMQAMLGSVIEKMALFFAQQGCTDPMNEAFLFGSMMDGIFMNYLMNPTFIDLHKMKDIIVRRFS